MNSGVVCVIYITLITLYLRVFCLLSEWLFLLCCSHFFILRLRHLLATSFYYLFYFTPFFLFLLLFVSLPLFQLCVLGLIIANPYFCSFSISRPWLISLFATPNPSFYVPFLTNLAFILSLYRIFGLA